MENIELLFKSYFSEIKLMDRTLPKYLYNDFFFPTKLSLAVKVVAVVVAWNTFANSYHASQIEPKTGILRALQLLRTFAFIAGLPMNKVTSASQ